MGLRQAISPAIHFVNATAVQKRHGSAVGIAAGYVLDDREGSEFESLCDQNGHFSISSRPAVGPLSLLSKGYLALFRRGQSGRGVKLTTSASAEVKKSGSIHPLPHSSSSSWCLVRYAQGNLFLLVALLKYRPYNEYNYGLELCLQMSV
jgi:hypothetical protein